jgi:hypothetical protein
LIAEWERQIEDATSGRNSADKDILADAVAWAYLLKIYYESELD